MTTKMIKVSEYIDKYLHNELILNNQLISNFEDFELVNGKDYKLVNYTNEEYDPEKYDSEEEFLEEVGEPKYIEFIQYWIVSQSAANDLIDYTDEPVYYSQDLDLYLWAFPCGRVSYEDTYIPMEVYDESDPAPDTFVKRLENAII